MLVLAKVHGDHLSGKPGNVREFETCQGNVRDYVNSHGNVTEKSCQGKVSQNCSLLVEYLRSALFFHIATVARGDTPPVFP